MPEVAHILIEPATTILILLFFWILWSVKQIVSARFKKEVDDSEIDFEAKIEKLEEKHDKELERLRDDLGRLKDDMNMQRIDMAETRADIRNIYSAISDIKDILREQK